MTQDRSDGPPVSPGHPGEPLRHSSGASRGSWRFGMLAIVVAVAAAFTVIVLVNQDVLSRGWAYAVLPVAIIAAAASRVLTIFKAASESKRS